MQREPECSQRLSSLLTASQAWPPSEALRLTRDLARALQTLHGSGLIHRAVDAEHVVMDAAGHARLDEAPAVRRVRLAGSVFADWPPELADLGEFDLPAELSACQELLQDKNVALDPRRIDIYQLGVLLCRLLTGAEMQAYLLRPAVKAAVPAAARSLLDRMLGYDAAEPLEECNGLLFAANQALGETPAALPPLADTAIAGVDGTHSAVARTPAEPAAATAHFGASPRLPFERLGHCRILNRLGQGGMGDVYRAFDETLERTVAIKVLSQSLAGDEGFVRRFRTEAAAIARLTHPNVVPIYSFGNDHEHNYFVMQLVDGESLSQRLARQGPLPVEETLRIVEQCLAALAAAHEEGLVHRDIKPANILLEKKTGRALLADFGLVKQISKTSGATAAGVVIGTVDYLSPEQARGRPVDARADLYSVGILLYEMLSGRLPFSADSPTAMIFHHAYEPPRPLSEACPQAPAQLDAIVSKLLKKKPAERYQTARELLDDLAAFRAGRPLAGAGQARELPSPALGSLEPAAVQLDRPGGPGAHRPQRRDAAEPSRPATAPRRALVRNSLRLCVGLAAAAGIGLASIKIYQHTTPPPPPLPSSTQTVWNNMGPILFRPGVDAAAPIFLASDSDHNLIEHEIRPDGTLRSGKPILELANKASVTAAAYSPDGRRLALAVQESSTIRIFDLSTRSVVRRLTGHRGDVVSVAFSPDGSQLLSLGASDGTQPPPEGSFLSTARGDSTLRLWDIATETELWSDYSHGLWFPEGHKFFAYGGRGGESAVRIIDAKSLTTERTIPLAPMPQTLTCSVDGRKLIGWTFGKATIWDAESGIELHQLGADLKGIAASRDGRLVLGFEQNHLKLWDVESGGVAAELPDTSGQIAQAFFSPDSRWVVCLASGELHVRRLPDKRRTGLVNSLQADSKVRCVAFSPDGFLALYGTQTGGAVWDIQQPKENLVAWKAPRQISTVAYARDSERVAYGCDQPNRRLNELITVQIVRSQRYPLLGNAEELRRLPGHQGQVAAAAWLPGDKQIISAGADGELRIWDLNDEEHPESIKLGTPLHAMALSADGRRALAGGEDGLVHVVDLDKREQQPSLEGSSFALHAVAISGDGRRAAAGGVGRTIWVWDLEKRQPIAELKGHRGRINALAFMRDGKRVLSGGDDATLRMWDIDAGSEVFRVDAHEGPLRGVAVSWDGRHALTGGDDGVVRLWDLKQLERGGPPDEE